MEETLEDIGHGDTKRIDKINQNIEKSDQQVCEVFLEGKQSIGKEKNV